MTRTEWLSILRETLNAELPQNEIDQNLVYYRDYIDREAALRSELEVLNELGEPRLIGKTIVDTYKMQRGNDGYNAYGGNSSHDYSDMFDRYRSAETVDEEGNVERGPIHFQVKKIRWYHKALLFAILALLVVLVVVVGGVILRLFFTIGLPVFLVIMLIEMIKKK